MHHYGKGGERNLCSRRMKKQASTRSLIKKDKNKKKRVYGHYTVGLPPVAQETAKTKGINKTAEMKVKDEPCTTIADEEDNEFPDQSTNERNDYVKKCDKDIATSWSGIQEHS